MFHRLHSLSSFFKIASVRLSITAGLLGLLGLIAACSTPTVETPTRFVPIPTTVIPTVTRTPTATRTATVPPIPALEPLVIPSPPANGTLLTLSPDSAFTGWVANQQSGINSGDSTLRAGIFQGQLYSSLLHFDLRALAPGSRVLFGTLEITGIAATNANTGEWVLDVVDSNSVKYENLTYDSLQKAQRLSTIGTPLTPKDLAVGYTNRFIFAPNDLTQVEKQLNDGILVLRLNGPTTGTNNLFTWNAGVNSRPPTLYLVTIPASYVPITNTPTPHNVFAAATLSANQTAQARLVGTPTPLPRNYATITPGGPAFAPDVIVTSIPTASDPKQATATAVYATAVAATTGTFTPIPSNWVTATPRPVFIPIEQLTPVPTPTPGIPQLGTLELAKMPLPAGLYNKILFLEGSREKPNIWVMNPDGTILGLVTDRTVFDIAKAREAISPDGVYYVSQSISPDTGYQLSLMNLHFPNVLPVPIYPRGSIIYGQAWAPDSAKFAYVTDDQNHQEIFEYTVANHAQKRIGINPDGFWDQFPSYSPDGKQIVFSSDRGHPGTSSEIWVMNADGNGATKLGRGTMDAYNPVWIKWQK